MMMMMFIGTETLVTAKHAERSAGTHDQQNHKTKRGLCFRQVPVVPSI